MPGGYIEFGCKPRTDRLGSQAPIFEDRIEVIPRDQWRELIEKYGVTDRPNVLDIKNQAQEGSCSANAGTQGWQVTCVDQLGKDYFVNLSAISLYKRTGSSPNSGSSVGDNVRELRDVGALPAIGEESKLRRMGLDPSHVMPHTGFYTRFPAGWQETAKHFRIVEYFDIASMDGFCTALLLGFVVHYGRRGHSILAVSLKWKDGQFYIEYANSWDESWGDRGFGLDTESGLRSAVNSYGAYAYRTVYPSEALLKLGRAA